MEGKVIKEESVGPSPCPSPLLATSTSIVPSGKENRRVGSPLNSSEILTRSRSKGLGKESSHSHHNLHHHHHHHHHHQRGSESPKGSGGSGSSLVIAPSSPSPPGKSSGSSSSSSGNSRESASGNPGVATSASSSHHPHHHTSTSSAFGSGGLHHQYGTSSSNSSRVEGTPQALNMSSSSGAVSPPVNGSLTPASGSSGNAISSGGGGGGGSSNSRESSSVGNATTASAVATTTGSAGSTTRTPSSSSSSNSSASGSSNGLNPGVGGASLRHILKIKRFLGTLLHFGCEISHDVGERVRNLVFNLVSGHLSIEEFHHSLQEVTSFPLRPFVLPFLRAHLPILQREVSHLARLSKQTPLSYIQSHEHAIIDTGSSPGEPCDIFHSEASEMGLSGKRKLPDSLYENGETGEPGYTSTPKRHHASFFSPPFFISASSAAAATSAAMTAAEFREYYASAAAAAGYPICSSSSSSSGNNNSTASQSHHATPHTTGHHEPPSQAVAAAAAAAAASNGLHLTPKGPEDEWKNIHVMLNCILSMVEKTKRALTILQNRTFQQEQGDGASSSSWLRRPPMYPNLETNEELKRQTSEMIAQALRATEDRVSEVKRRAEEAVQEVKRQALVELKRAVAAAENRALESFAAERARMDRILMDSRRTPGELANPIMVGSGIDPEACWNCGRKAHETCSGCNMARYCSSFCQHKDWENHHTVCGRVGPSSSSERASVAPADSKSSSHHARENSNSPSNVRNSTPPQDHSPGSTN